MTKLRAPGAKEITLQPVRPNLGIEADYRRRLHAMVDKMHKSILHWVTATYRANTPHAAMAADASPAVEMRKMMHKLGRRWQRQFNDGAKDLAAHFAAKSMGTADTSLQMILKNAGFTVAFKRTAPVNDAYQAVIGENVGLIKSIASKHLSDVEGLVMRSVQHGRQLDVLRDELVERYGVTKKRAAFIARDQNNKATAIMDKVRSKSLGIKKARWVHSGGGIHPRESHEEADGVVYELEVGCLIDGEYIMPGELPNCRCVKRSIIPGFDEGDE
jgi:uncharacterized protein with gpF-like domain